MAYPPEQINLLQVAQVIEGEKLLPECLFELTEGFDQESCPTRAFWDDVRGRIRAGLEGVSIQDVADHLHDRLIHCTTCCTRDVKAETDDRKPPDCD